ncbi:ATP-binding cassette domain-containing protein [Janibacter indicus]|uniref:ATP-binding cassette domain-containing protein n=1 Tax=Janibacter indicus TaxID=857417 RepID=UPI003D9A84D3
MLIDVRDVTHGFDGGAPVLRDVTVRLTEQRVGVIGANGSGKSTFARMLNGPSCPSRAR